MMYTLVHPPLIYSNVHRVEVVFKILEIFETVKKCVKMKSVRYKYIQVSVYEAYIDNEYNLQMFTHWKNEYIR